MFEIADFIIENFKDEPHLFGEADKIIFIEYGQAYERS